MKKFNRLLLLGLASVLVAGSAYIRFDSRQQKKKTPKSIFVIIDGVPADVIEKLKPPILMEISKTGGYTRAHVGGGRQLYNQTPTISAPGYICLLTGTWANKHNVWDNDIAEPNYNYWNIFRVAETIDPNIKTAIFSTWLENRTKLIGEGLAAAGSINLDYAFDGLERDTIRFPHDKEANHIRHIDDAVSEEAARYILKEGPDLSWVYLEYTDDMGHQFGDSPQFYEAIKVADQQIGRIWEAIRQREKKFDEDWLLVITTDHGRDANTGKNHGGQSDRERTTWITTNSKQLNARFKQTPAIVDIAPSIFNHMQWSIPDAVKNEMDGVPFIGKIDVANLTARKEGNIVTIQWEAFVQKNAKATAEVLIANTNNFKTGGLDEYQKVGEVIIGKEKFSFPEKGHAPLSKVILKTQTQTSNVWVTE